MIKLTASGSFANTNKFLQRLTGGDIYSGIEKYAQQGVDALANATPRDSGETANAWEYRILKSKGSFKIEWYNNNVVNGENIAILIQYGHGTGTGGYVQGRDYINPAIRPIFDKMAEEVWEKVKK